MKVISRRDALDAILAKYGVDLYDYTEGLSVATPAMVCVEIMFEILTADVKGGHAAERLTDNAPHWTQNEQTLMSYAVEISHYAQLIRKLTTLLDLGMAPYLPRKEES